ncbi:GntR family transcriptional regulator [Neorhodopirellula pilleata]|uniref:HTH-type transcriptional repressor YtrA n=1 Tax=Neorhodopirellula pilleata TaxID=2714738 RepID=A0A5C6A643_9BACT|nr:GntR family transcriptional regulator [Neorhodopirellula pilleata]TWT95442.1 HTH-type transcriptional repressor YtrA [Neorhodopirellula pilleata]
MLLHLSAEGPPIYQQIVEQIRSRIISGQFQPGDELPTIRGLAESARVNPNTIARAYRELENEGLVEKRRTRGTFVSQNTPSLSVAQRRKRLTPEVDRVLILASQTGVSVEELIDLIQRRRSLIEQKP